MIIGDSSFMNASFRFSWVLCPFANRNRDTKKSYTCDDNATKDTTNQRLILFLSLPSLSFSLISNVLLLSLVFSLHSNNRKKFQFFFVFDIRSLLDFSSFHFSQNKTQRIFLCFRSLKWILVSLSLLRNSM
ncbi:hypothetical protein RIF29_40906 [Crotalaria pallida]|uniref:Transmembrane protein n=1 Tax=Crotalaria pallida TaxID=3830 RepID=A0AAN9HUQ8_CROPI